MELTWKVEKKESGDWTYFYGFNGTEFIEHGDLSTMLKGMDLFTIDRYSHLCADPGHAQGDTGVVLYSSGGYSLHLGIKPKCTEKVYEE